MFKKKCFKKKFPKSTSSYFILHNVFCEKTCFELKLLMFFLMFASLIITNDSVCKKQFCQKYDISCTSQSKNLPFI